MNSRDQQPGPKALLPGRKNGPAHVVTKIQERGGQHAPLGTVPDQDRALLRSNQTARAPIVRINEGNRRVHTRRKLPAAINVEMVAGAGGVQLREQLVDKQLVAAFAAGTATAQRTKRRPK